ncbi:MAG TPA: DNA polymerase Y family protein [Mucilaginibacter sp.]|jgi:protein ImuB|nr:DNA polymerase Y family protein [Mucilaginibacter sp.]
MGQRFVSVWFRHLLTDWLALRRPELRGLPFVFARSDHGRMVITAANPAAEAQGIVPGMVVADAKAIFPSLEVIDHIPGKAEKLLKRLGEWCLRYTPVTAIDLPDGLIFEISGCAHLWGGEEPYLKEIVARFNSKGYDVRAAMADTIGAAWAIARFGQGAAIVGPGEQVNALLPLPPVGLRLNTAILDRLQKLGLYTIGSFAGMQRSALRRRFGQELLVRLAQALGQEEESLQPLQFIEPYQERLPCLEPIRTATGIEIAIKTLLENLCKRLYSEGMGLRTAVLRCYRVDGGVVGADIGTNRPTCDTGHLFKLFELKIASIEPALGIELFTLDAPKVDDISPEQEVLWASEGAGLDDGDLVNLLDRLRNKIGAQNIHRYLAQESYWPERSVKPAQSLTEKPATAWRTGRRRPSLLLRKPERIDVMNKLPDDPPKMFIYKGERHEIKKADDAERIEPEWWLRKRLHHDYYVVEDEQGRRYWVFRSGHYTDEGSQWYLHGFFA